MDVVQNVESSVLSGVKYYGKSQEKMYLDRRISIPPVFLSSIAFLYCVTALLYTYNLRESCPLTSVQDNLDKDKNGKPVTKKVRLWAFCNGRWQHTIAIPLAIILVASTYSKLSKIILYPREYATEVAARSFFKLF